MPTGEDRVREGQPGGRRRWHGAVRAQAERVRGEGAQERPQAEEGSCRHRDLHVPVGPGRQPGLPHGDVAHKVEEIAAAGLAVQGAGPRGLPRTAALRGALVVLLAAAMLGASASSASAVIVQLGNGKTLSYLPARGSAPASTRASPFDVFFKNLDYNGGPVMTSNTNYTFYWRPKTAKPYPAGYTAGVNNHFKDLEHDSGGGQNVESVAAQYNDAAGGF